MAKCEWCDGKGKWRNPFGSGFNADPGPWQKCKRCNGTGRSGTPDAPGSVPVTTVKRMDWDWDEQQPAPEVQR